MKEQAAGAARNTQRTGQSVTCGQQPARGHLPVLTTAEAGVPSTPATRAHTRTVYSVSGSSPSSSATVASPETNWDFSGPRSEDEGSSRTILTLTPNVSPGPLKKPPAPIPPRPAPCHNLQNLWSFPKSLVPTSA